MPSAEQKLQRRLFELRTRAWYLETQPCADWEVQPGDKAVFDPAQLSPKRWRAFSVPGEWGGYDVYTWFRRRLAVPAGWRGRPVALVLNCLGDRGEGLVFVDRQPVQGIDRHHDEILLATRAKAGQEWEILLELYSGREPEPRRFHSALLVVPNQMVREFHYTCKNLLELALCLPPESGGRQQVLELLLSVEREVDFRTPGSAAFQASVQHANEFLRGELEEHLARTPRPSNRRSDPAATGRLWIFGHAHLDVCWLWTQEEVKRKCARTFATALHLMAQYPEYRFVQSQPQLYEMLQAHYPGLYARLRQQVRAGRWEPVGAMWVEADCNLSGGEALVRQVVYGKRFFQREFQVDVDQLWLPDVFGYPAALPQILAQAGVTNFFTAKIAWNEHSKFPHSTFWWQGIDGTRVLSHLTFLHNLYNSELTAADVKEAWDTFRQKAVSQDLLLSYGWGDGGGGPTPDHLENARRLERLVHLPAGAGQMPQLQRGTLRECFAALRASRGPLPVWRGEIYLEAHRGTLTTQAEIKRANRKCELLLREAEALTAMAGVFGFHAAPEQLEYAWKKVLLNQFHDILPGSSIPPVYEQARRDYTEVQEIGEKIVSQAMRHLAAQVRTNSDLPTVVVFNTLSWPRREPVEVHVPDLPRHFQVEDAAGNAVATQVLAREGRLTRLLVDATVPPFGFAAFYFRPAESGAAAAAPAGILKAEGTNLENDLLLASFDHGGRLVSLWDRRVQREILASGRQGNLLQTFEDTPAYWEAWDINSDFEAKPLALFHCKSVRVGEKGPLRVSLRMVHAARHSRIEQEVFLYRDHPRLDFRTRIDWHESRTLLKVAFPVEVMSDRGTFEIQFGSVQRPTHRNTTWDAGKFEVAAHKWIDLSEANYGVSLLNDCRYGHDILENQLRLTLLRSPYMPHAFEPHLQVDWDHLADQGRHELVYALYPHLHDWRAGGTVPAAYELNIPLRALVLPAQRRSGTSAFELLRASAPGIVLETAKPADDGKGMILRWYEAHGGRGPVQLTWSQPPRRVEWVNLLEEKLATLEMQGRTLALHFTPFEIKTLRVVF